MYELYCGIPFLVIQHRFSKKATIFCQILVAIFRKPEPKNKNYTIVVTITYKLDTIIQQVPNLFLSLEKQVCNLTANYDLPNQRVEE